MSDRDTDFWIKSAYLEPFRQACLAYDLDPLQLMARRGLAEAMLRVGNQQFSHAVYAQLIDDGAKESGDSLFGMAVGELFRLDNVDATDLLVLPRMSLLDFYPVIQHLFSVQSRATRYQLLHRGKLAYHSVESRMPEHIDGRQLVLLILCAHHTLFKQIFGPGWQPSRVLLRQQPAKDREALEAFFACPVLLGASLDALEIPNSALSLVAKDEAMDNQQMRLMRGDALRRFADVPGLIRCFIESRLPDGRFEQLDLACWLGVHPRVLQKCLQERNTSYAELLRDSRVKLACRMLENTRLPISEVALQLGYSQSSVFVRTFKRWKGVTPLQWRRQATKVHIT